ncbi:MAG TPA: recombinase family protein [Longimicrobium sp.]
MKSIEPEGKRVGIWLRVSTEDQVKGESPEHHERRARFYAEAKGWTVVEVYNLGDWSGKTVVDHPEAKRMLADIRSGHVSGLVFSKLARLARNVRELLDFADYFQKHGADLISLGESIDTSTPAGRLFYTIIAAMAQWEREETAARVAASIPIRARMGKRLGPQAPLGYKFQNNQMVVDLETAPVRRLIYELFAEHRRVKAVVSILNERGYRTRKGELFTFQTVQRLIADPTAKGLRRANYTRKTEEGNVALKPEAEWVWLPIEAIVSEELWERCNSLLAGRVKRERRVGKRPVHLFSGVVFCEDGSKMYPLSNSPKYTCKTCRRKIHPDDLEAVFVSQLRGFVFSPKDLAEHVANADTELKTKVELLEALQRERAKVASDMDKTYRLYLADQLSPQGFDARYRPLETRLAQLDDELPELQAEVDFRKVQLLSRDEIISEAQTLYTRWQDLTIDEKRTIIETIVRSITVGESEIRIEMEHLLPFGEEAVNWSRNYVSA